MIIKNGDTLEHYGLKLSDLTPEMKNLYINKVFPQIQRGYSLDYYGLKLSDFTPQQQKLIQ